MPVSRIPTSCHTRPIPTASDAVSRAAIVVTDPTEREEPMRGQRQGHEQRADQRRRRAGSGHEEVTKRRRNHGPERRRVPRAAAGAAWRSRRARLWENDARVLNGSADGGVYGGDGRRVAAPSTARWRWPGWACAATLALTAFPGPALADFTIAEGAHFSGNVADIGSCQSPVVASIYWGDGTPASAGTYDGASGVTGSHTYADERTTSGNVTYTCHGGPSAEKSFQVTVIDASLTSAGVDIAGTAGQALTAVVAHVDDANPAPNTTDFTAQIAWGDGTTSAGSVASAAGGGFDVTSTHTYDTAGSYTVSTSVTDIGGSSTTTHASARMAAAPPAVPRSYAAPVVSGEPRQEEPLTTTTGNWSDAPTGFQYQWERCATPAGADCAVIPGATARSYTAVHADVGMTVRARVRAINGAGTSLPADSAPTAVVQPFVIRARFTISPNPTCAGLPVILDASVSKTPNPPITRYRFTSVVIPILPVTKREESPSTQLLADGISPRVSDTVGYNYQFHPEPDLPAALDYTFVAEPRLYTLTVTDGTGASASYSAELDFVENYLGPADFSIGSRAACPISAHEHSTIEHLLLDRIKLTATKTTVSAKLGCARFAECAGKLRLLAQSAPNRRALVSTRPRRAARPAVLASSAFLFFSGHSARTIKLKLTGAGRALVRRGRPLHAIAQLTTLGPTGRMTTKSLAVTIGSHRR
jgi:hypothetical protein